MEGFAMKAGTCPAPLYFPPDGGAMDDLSM